jgi:hypothetical protein
MRKAALLFSFLVSLCFCSPRVGTFDRIDAGNAGSVTSFDENDIESMVTFYFASRIRGDQDWRKVLPDSTQWSDRMKHSIARHNEWKFVEFQNKKLYTGNYGTYVKVHFTIEYKGRQDGGDDDVELEKQDGRWIIAKVPI